MLVKPYCNIHSITQICTLRCDITLLCAFSRHVIISRPEKTSWDTHCRARGSIERREKEPFAGPQPIPCFFTDFSGHGALHRSPQCGDSSRFVTNQMVNQSSCMSVTNGIFKNGTWLRYTNSVMLATCNHCIEKSFDV